MNHKLQIGWNQQGEVCSFRADGKELAAEKTVPLFQVQFRDFIGNPLLLNSRDFQQASIRETGEGFQLEFSVCRRLPETVATASVRLEGKQTFWNLSVTPGKAAFTVEWLDFPRIAFRCIPGGKWLLPVNEGMLVESLVAREKIGRGVHLAEYALNGVSSFYPGSAAMQFEAYLTKNVSLYFSCPDIQHHPKTIDFLPDGEESFSPTLQQFTGGDTALSYETELRVFHGDWMEAAEIYRNWMEKNDPSLPSKLKDDPIPWMKDSPVLLIYPVKGNGKDADSLTPNEYFPYRNALPVIEKYQQEFQCRIMALLMHWEGTAPWAPPYIWPPYGGETGLKEFVDVMHRAGNLVGLYGSGIGWTQQSMIDPSYDRTADFEKNHIRDEICIGPQGEAFSRVCNGATGQRLGYDLCPGRKFTGDTVAQEIGSASALGVDYLQYFDQNQGCTSPMCYAKNHGHPALPGPWQTTAMQKLLDQAQSAAGRTVIGCENAAAEPYLKVCRLNDLRSHLAWGSAGRQIPLYSYLFHEYAAGFSGNGVCLGFWIDFEKTPFFLQWFLAWHFAAGNLLSVVLKDAGKIHWCWVKSWSDQEPAQEPLKKLICNLTRWRKGPAAPYLIDGRMEKKPSVDCRQQPIWRLDGTKETVPAVESSAWSTENSRALVLVNYNETAEKCCVAFEQETAGTLCSEDSETAFRTKSLEVEVPPLTMRMLRMPLP